MIQGLDEFITQFPVFEYVDFGTDELTFEDRVRHICKEECARYGTTWACPPAVGTLEECADRCHKYDRVLLFSTVAEVSDIMNFEETLQTRAVHEEITRQIGDYVKDQGYMVQILSTESCAICEKCAYPDGPCRFPDKMHPCVESHGLVVTELAENHGMTFSLGGNTILWFSIVLYR